MDERCDSCAGTGRVRSGASEGICLVCDGTGRRKRASGSSGCVVFLPLVGVTMLLTTVGISYIV